MQSILKTSPEARAEAVRAALPRAGMFTGKEWEFSPDPFPLSRKQWQALEGLGHRLWRFLRGCDGFYRRSAQGRMAEWIAPLLDAGKPEWLVEAARSTPAGQLPRVIRPDLVLTGDGFALTEIDSVPGGIGLLDWLNHTYGGLGFEVAGGADGMRDGFASCFSEPAEIVVSQEARDYRPEMDWLAGRLVAAHRDGWKVVDASTWQPSGAPAYRFFELFDWENLPGFHEWVAAWADGALDITAPFVPWIEEKAWLALFWSAPLRDAWAMELRRNHQRALADVIPFGWVVDPTPLPPHGVLPHLEVESWEKVADFTQRERELVLKVSGFSPIGWGARSVTVGHDVAHDAWREAVNRAARDFPAQPWVMQQFRHARTVHHPVMRKNGQVEDMEGKVRLTPYYFVGDTGHTRLGGVHATICPADKKVLHGMRDAVMVPCTVVD